MDGLYIPEQDDSVIPINYLSTFVLENDRKRRKGERLETMSMKGKVQSIWKDISQDVELMDCLNIENLWEKPSLK